MSDDWRAWPLLATLRDDLHDAVRDVENVAAGFRNGTEARVHERCCDDCRDAIDDALDGAADYFADAEADLRAALDLVTGILLGLANYEPAKCVGLADMFERHGHAATSHIAARIREGHRAQWSVDAAGRHLLTLRGRLIGVIDTAARIGIPSGGACWTVLDVTTGASVGCNTWHRTTTAGGPAIYVAPSLDEARAEVLRHATDLYGLGGAA